MSTLRTNTISNAAGTASVPTDTVVSGTAKAWVNFNGTGVVAIRASFNVSSITDNGTGDYTINMTTALADINFAFNGTCSLITGSNCPVVFDNSPARPRTTSSFSIRTMDIGAFGDPVWANISVFR